MAVSRELWSLGFLRAQKAEKELEYFLKYKAVEQIEFTGSALLFFTILTEAPNLAGSAVSRSLYFAFMRCCHAIIFPRVGLCPTDLQRQSGRKAAGVVVWGLPERRKTLTLNKLDQ